MSVKGSTLLLRLNGPTMVIIDWANVYGWQRTLGLRIDAKKIFRYFNSYKKVERQCFYFGKDENEKSLTFLENIDKIGYEVHTKPVKYIYDKTLHRLIRKCDFDLEITIDVLEDINKFKTFIFLSGDGDFAELYLRLLNKRKQVVVVYSHGSLGREIWDMRQMIYLLDIQKVVNKKSAPDKAGVSIWK